MKELKITKGEWGVRITEKRAYPYIEGNNCKIADITQPSAVTFKEARANAKLIADAGTTANKCGLLPSELLARNEELLEALKIAKKTIFSFHGETAWLIYDRHSPEMIKINQAITKAQGE